MVDIIFMQDTEKRAEAILKQLQGMSITSARDLLNWCGDYMLNQPVGEWCLKPEKQEKTTPETRIPRRPEDTQVLGAGETINIKRR